jgi:predicted HAD superfamily Cof-like phosphohydrolase
MKKQIEQLKEFHTKFNLPQRDFPTIIPFKEFHCRQTLIDEELDELVKAFHDHNRVGVVDALVDSMYVLIGTALQFGVVDVLEECFDEVHRSNMSKLDTDGKPITDQLGKVMKGPNYSPPDIVRILNDTYPE